MASPSNSLRRKKRRCSRPRKRVLPTRYPGRTQTRKTRLFGHDQLIKLPKSPLPGLRTAASDAGAGLRTAASDLRAKFQEPAEEAEAGSKQGKPKVQKDEEERLQDKAASLHKQALADQGKSIKQDLDERALMRQMKKKFH